LLAAERLNARDRMRLSRLERAVLPRSFDAAALVAALREEHLPTINLAILPKGEPRAFGLALMMALSQAGSWDG
jgi:hypothetical protein